ncbi:glycosyl transferase family protein [Saccharospirillum impatiens]|uniref:glycosyl transferase family protein n=1 Tax=Saccharospirillum impatiens TaxID=169438 RepID=UPI00040C529B|nr:glycosyl transferase family protein [Saccharospirillum impatiens]
MSEPLKFADLIRALGRGKNGSRSLSREEAHFAMQEIWHQRETQAQLGALLMLMRVKEETAEELAGMAQAVRDELDTWDGQAMHIDWPAYAGKRRQPSWYVLAAKALAQGGYRVFMHGGGEHTAGRQYARQVCEALSIPIAASWQQAATLSQNHTMVYCPLASFAPSLSHIIDMKQELGLRSPVNTLVRNLNPTGADVTLQGMFHPSYKALHHDTANLLGDRLNIVLKGDSGEFEVRPDSNAVVRVNSPRHPDSLEVPKRLPQRAVRPDEPSLSLLQTTWAGESNPEYGIAAIQETMALVLMVADGLSLQNARNKALLLWQQRLLAD